MKEALKSRDDLRISVVRMLLSDIHNQEIQNRGPLAPEQEQEVLMRSAKKHQDSIAQFRSGGRDDLVEQETGELQIIQSYLPEPFSAKELEALVSAAVAEAGAHGPQDFGKVMKVLMPRVKGRSAGQEISQAVKEAIDKLKA